LEARSGGGRLTVPAAFFIDAVAIPAYGNIYRRAG
jgi:hypothetical protein